MQYHLDGYQPGDPAIGDDAKRLASGGASGPLPKEVDVLIIGCGPAGLTLAAQLAQFSAIKTCIIEQKEGRLLRGQADGIACRTVEMFNAFGFAERAMREAYWVNEVTFWKPDPIRPDHIARSGRVQDVEDGLSEFPHLILNQARVHDFYLESMHNGPTQLQPHYHRKLAGLLREGERVSVQIENLATGTTESICARYVIGCDGARSTVRKSLGLALQGDSANQAWGVMDILGNTDFPDIRLKAVIQSHHGSVVLIPREGGYMFRIYVELEKLAQSERVADKQLTLDDLVAAANRIFAPYKIEPKEVPWWSVYEIGQRLCDRFDDDAQNPRIFIAGDACHTHSPKAGQGMNVSMQDAYNLGWKLAAVLRGISDPALLKTYSAERQAIAAELIHFDKDWAGMLHRASKGQASAAEVQDFFVRQGRYTAGTATHYQPSTLTGPGEAQHLAKGLTIGMRFHSAPVIRLADAKRMHLSHCMQADGKWRVLLFADDARSKLATLCHWFQNDADSPFKRHHLIGEDLDSVIDLRAVLQQPHHALAITDMPAVLFPAKGKLGLRDYEKVFCVDAAPGADIFETRSIDRKQGAMVIVRPDQYIANVLALDDHAGLVRFFNAVLLPRS